MVEVTRGDIVVVALPGDYGKPRPAVVVQADEFHDDFDSVLIYPFTTDLTSHSVARILVSPAPETGLTLPSHIMVEKLTVVARSKISQVIGRLGEHLIERLNSSLSSLLDLA